MRKNFFWTFSKIRETKEVECKLLGSAINPEPNGATVIITVQKAFLLCSLEI